MRFRSNVQPHALLQPAWEIRSEKQEALLAERHTSGYLICSALMSAGKKVRETNQPQSSDMCSENKSDDELLCCFHVQDLETQYLLLFQTGE